MGVITTGQTFASGDQVTASKLNDIGNDAVFNDPVDGSTLIANNSTYGVSGGNGKLKVKDLGITATQLAADSVITAKIQDGAVTAVKLDAGAVSVLMPTGSIMPYAGASPAPTGYLLCNDTPISRTTYSALFALIGTTYGSGDGSTTFNIPDLRGRVIAGQDDMGGSSANRLTGLAGGVDGDVLGGSGGSETHTLLIAEIPSHDHTVQFQVGGAGSGYPGFDGSGDARNSGDSGLTGGGGAHNNVQPTIILNYIIKT